MSERVTYGKLMRLVDDKSTGVIYEHLESLRAQLAAVERERDERLAQVLYTRQERDFAAARVAEEREVHRILRWLYLTAEEAIERTDWSELSNVVLDAGVRAAALRAPDGEVTP